MIPTLNTRDVLRYEAALFPTGPLVFEMPARLVEADGFETIDDARHYARTLNDWLSAKPTTGQMLDEFGFYTRPQDVPKDPGDALVQIIDRIHRNAPSPQADLDVWPRYGRGPHADH